MLATNSFHLNPVPEIRLVSRSMKSSAQLAVACCMAVVESFQEIASFSIGACRSAASFLLEAARKALAWLAISVMRA